MQLIRTQCTMSDPSIHAFRGRHRLMTFGKLHSLHERYDDRLRAHGAWRLATKDRYN